MQVVSYEYYLLSVFSDDALGTSLDQRVTRFHQIQSVSVDNSLPKTPAVLTGMPRRASVLFLLLHGGSA